MVNFRHTLEPTTFTVNLSTDNSNHRRKRHWGTCDRRRFINKLCGKRYYVQSRLFGLWVNRNHLLHNRCCNNIGFNTLRGFKI